MRRVRKEVQRLLEKHRKEVKLNLGCGTDYKQGWINVDNNSDNNITKLDFNWDLTKPLPFPDSSVDYIFNEHFIEHLTVEEGQTALKDCLRVLKKGGVMRIATPDLARTVEKYRTIEIKNDPTVKKYGLGFVKTKAERMNIAFRWWGHKWLYDWEELERRLKEAGYKKIKRCVLGKSSHQPLNGLETREESTLIAEVTK